MLYGMVWPCQLAAIHAYLSVVSRFEMSFVFELQAKPKGIPLALDKHGNGCKKGCGYVEWKEESKLGITNSKLSYQTHFNSL